MRRGAAATSSKLLRAACRLVLAGLTVVAASACSASSQDPLIVLEGPGGISGCIPAPDPAVAAAIPTWNSQIGFALDMYYNRSSMPVSIETVKLLDPHNLVLHGSAVYEIIHSKRPLPLEAAWNREGQGNTATGWSHRQLIPAAPSHAFHDAVIPPGHGPYPGRPSRRFNLYEIVVDVSAAGPQGGWALGEQVTYKAAGVSYTLDAKTGIAIGDGRLPMSRTCNSQLNKISAALRSSAWS